jgi:RNA polymerase sigma-54 factor
VCDHLDALAEGRLDDIAAAVAASPESVALAVDLIRRHVQPWPVADSADHPVRAAPDVEFAVSVDPAGEPVVVAKAADPWRGALRLAPDIVDLTRSTDRRARVFAAELLSAARAFLLALDRRATTVERVATAAGRHHAEHLLAGSMAFRPLTRRQVAEELDLHESTISRAVTGRVAKLPGGRVVALSRLFGSGHDIRARVAELLAENSALSDREVAALLAAEGMTASRRTVANRRAELGLGRRQKSPSRRAGCLAPPPKPGSPELVPGAPNEPPPSGWHGTCSQGD